MGKVKKWGQRWRGRGRRKERRGNEREGRGGKAQVYIGKFGFRKGPHFCDHEEGSQQARSQLTARKQRHGSENQDRKGLYTKSPLTSGCSPYHVVLGEEESGLVRR